MFKVIDEILRQQFHEAYPMFDYEKERPTVWFLAILLLILVIGAVALLLSALYSALDWYTGKWYVRKGEIVDHNYQAARSSTSVGMGVSSNGPVPLVASSSSPESFTLFARDEDGEIVKIPAGMQLYFDLKEGDRISYARKKGGISKSWLRTKNPIKL